MGGGGEGGGILRLVYYHSPVPPILVICPNVFPPREYHKSDDL